MSKTLALLHTSQLFVGKENLFQPLIDEILPDVQIINILDDSLLSHCMADGSISPALTRRMCAYVVAAETAGADAALSLCSSLGPTIDVARQLVRIPVLKIDDAHTAAAVERAPRIGVLATTPTTLRPTVALLREKAAARGRDVAIHEALAGDALQALMAGDRNRHDALLLEKAAEVAADVDLLLCAQASMTRLAPRLEEETRLPVLTSPRAAVELAREVLFDKRAA